ncbi:MAG: 4-hydroxy-tetrahydrodipicolinate synthase [Sphingomonadales bacterium]|nr:4-hydroxy-tetrahydrodipicolinate synthase [Sphingomonadales bacterium]
MFSGSIPALVTPFRGEANGAGAVDEDAFRALVDWQIDQGSHALVPCGTTGEAPTLDMDEHHRVIALCVDQAAGRVPVIAGCGSNDTRTAREHMRRAKAAGADAALVVVPYYNRPSQDGIVAHFRALADAGDLPIVVYNVPARTVTDVLPDTLARLAQIDGIVGIKDASGVIDRVTAHRLGCGTDFCQLSGNDNQALAFMAAGGSGCISVSANVAPKLCADFQNACTAGEWDRARDLNDRLYPLHCALFADASPGPVKYALSRVRADFPASVRLPIIACSDAAKRAVDAALAIAGLA